MVKTIPLSVEVIRSEFRYPEEIVNVSTVEHMLSLLLAPNCPLELLEVYAFPTKEDWPYDQSLFYWTQIASRSLAY